MRNHLWILFLFHFVARIRSSGFCEKKLRGLAVKSVISISGFLIFFQHVSVHGLLHSDGHEGIVCCFLYL